MIGIRQLLNHYAAKRLRLRARQIADFARDPLATVYPQEIVFEGSPQHVDVLTPHADDETFGAGGTLLRHLARGDSVMVRLFSDNVTSIDSDGLSEEEKRSLREGEFSAAMAELGITTHQALGLGNSAFRDDVYPEAVFRQLIENKADVLYLPSLFDNHRDHRVLNIWLLRALQEHRSFRPLIRGFEVWSPLPATAVTDITQQIDRKRAAMRCYRSQLEAIDYQHHLEGLHAYRAMTLGGKRAQYAEAFLELPADAYLELGNSLLL